MELAVVWIKACDRGINVDEDAGGGYVTKRVMLFLILLERHSDRALKALNLPTARLPTRATFLCFGEDIVGSDSL
jgi:hypothetical protein